MDAGILWKVRGIQEKRACRGLKDVIYYAWRAQYTVTFVLSNLFLNLVFDSLICNKENFAPLPLTQRPLLAASIGLYKFSCLPSTLSHEQASLVRSGTSYIVHGLW